MITTNIAVAVNPVVTWIPKIAMSDGRIIKLAGKGDRALAFKDADAFASDLDDVDWTGVERIFS